MKGRRRVRGEEEGGGGGGGGVEKATVAKEAQHETVSAKHFSNPLIIKQARYCGEERAWADTPQRNEGVEK